MQKRYAEMTEDELGEVRGEPGSKDFQYRQFELQVRATRSQIAAANAAKDAADYAKQTVRWMFWSVIVLATASVISLLLDVW